MSAGARARRRVDARASQEGWAAARVDARAPQVAGARSCWGGPHRRDGREDDTAARPFSLGSPGDFYWSGAPMTQFWVDPTEDLAVVFLTQVIGSPHHHRIIRVLRNLVYGAMTERRG